MNRPSAPQALVKAEAMKLEITTLDALMGVQPGEQPAAKPKRERQKPKAKRVKNNKEQSAQAA